MNFLFFIARRYFFSKKKKHFINVISWLSILSVSFCTAALIIVLSVFNGFDILLHTLYASFDPELKVTAKKGKSFEATPSLISTISAIRGVEVVTQVIEDYGYLRYRDADMVIIFKGVSDNFIEQHRLDQYITQGKIQLKDKDINYALIGRGVQHTLSVSMENNIYPLQLFYIKSQNALRPMFSGSPPYTKENAYPIGVFSIEKNHDDNYIFIPLSCAERLSGYGNRRTALEIKISSSEDLKTVQENVRKAVGESFYVLNQDEQQKDLYRLLKIEKLFTFLSLSLLVLVGSINIFFVLMMLAIEKNKDIAVLQVMGLKPKSIRILFLMEGCITSFFGTMIGLMIGGFLCWLQATVGLVSLGMENAVVEHYPVEMLVSDFASVGATVGIITLIISFYPALFASRSYSVTQL